MLADSGHASTNLRSAVLRLLPATFDAIDLERALADVHHDLLVRPGAMATVQLLRKLVASAYQVEFDDDVALAQRVLMPSAAEESNGMEDARFTRFVDDGRLGRVPRDIHRVRRSAASPRGCSQAPTCGPFARIGWPAQPPATREWRCSRGSSADVIWRCAAPTARAPA